MAENDINFYIINATEIAEEIGLGNRTNTIMQSAFFKIADVIPYDFAVEKMKKAALKSFGKKGEDVVNKNYAAVDKGGAVHKVAVPAEWASIVLEDEVVDSSIPEFIRNIVNPINAQKGDDLPVSAFRGREDGTFPAGTTAYEKRGIAVTVPEWEVENCIQCNQCSYVCPHAAIRPFLLDTKELAEAPAGTLTKKPNGKGYEGLNYRIQVSVLDCTGCGNCADICPSKTKSLVMKPLDTQDAEIERWNYMAENVTIKDYITPKTLNVKSSQFAKPLFEFSGACAGCGETPHIKLITQLYGDRMLIANATGCSSIYGGSAPSTSYCTNSEGQGPAWANSLFEDNAEFGLGIATASETLRDRVRGLIQSNLEMVNPETKAAFEAWLAAFNDGDKTRSVSKAVEHALAKETNPVAAQILTMKDHLVKKSVWIFGGDGWAYDIGFGGLDHVLASGKNVNVLVMDTEVYSNTGGQSSKATPVGAIAKFAASGKRIRKKDLGLMATTYGYVYVAQVAIGANQNQYFKALKEAEAYDGPSLIIAYSPCINHGLRAGMGKSQEESKLAVECGYWHLYRYNPLLEEEGKNPFVLDSKEPEWNKFQDFLKGEVRYSSLQKAYPQDAKELFTAAENNAKWRYNSYKRLNDMVFETEE